MQKQYAQLFEESLKPTPKIVCIGKNYEEHVKEMGGNANPPEPVIFTKPTTSILRNRDNKVFKLPSHGRQIHHETELGILIGQRGKNIPTEESLNYIGGYFLALDMTDRDYQAGLKKSGYPWDLAKGQDDFMPISEFVSVDQVKDPQNLQLQLRINGKVIQDGNTSLMIHKIPKIISFVSQFMTLIPGDLILTGTPAGVGPFSVGDNVEAELIQENHVLAKIELKVE